MSEDEKAIVPVPRRREFLSSRGDRHLRISTRGPFVRTWQFDDPVDLFYLIDRMRGDERELPLTMVVAAGTLQPDSPATRFFDALLAEIDRRIDAIWVVTSGPTSWTPPVGSPLPVAVLLQTDDPLDARIASNLVADLLFLPSGDEADEHLLQRFLGRTALVIIPRDALRSAEVTALIETRDMTLMYWDGRMVETPAAPGVGYAGPATASTPAEIEAIGDHLAHLARRLKNVWDRRSVFQLALVGVKPAFRARPRWEDDLLRLADQFQWPAWAVQTLPALYLRTGGDEANVSAFVWRPLLEWIEKPETYLTTDGKLCGGEVWHVLIPSRINETVVDIHARLMKHREESPLHGDTTFFGLVQAAVDMVAQLRRRSDDPSWKRLRGLSLALPAYAKAT